MEDPNLKPQFKTVPSNLFFFNLPLRWSPLNNVQESFPSVVPTVGLTCSCWRVTKTWDKTRGSCSSSVWSTRFYSTIRRPSGGIWPYRGSPSFPCPPIRGWLVSILHISWIYLSFINDTDFIHNSKILRIRFGNIVSWFHFNFRSIFFLIWDFV